MKNILVIFGGKSAEHDISIITGITIINALKSIPEYTAIPLYIAKNGGWYTHEKLELLESYQNPETLSVLLNKTQTVSLDFQQGLSLKHTSLFKKPTPIHVAFPAMHGTNGEDGSLMGLLRLADIPFVGCDLQASVIAMDKVLTKQVTEKLGLPSTPYTYFTKDQWQSQKTQLENTLSHLNYPLFVKPVHLGSSIGISKVTDKDKLENAIDVAFHFDDKIIIEQAVPNLIEVTCLALGNESNPQTSLVEQPHWQADFLNFEDKYITKGGAITTGSKASTTIPANIDPELTNQVKLLTLKAFQAIGASGIARCDFLINQNTREVYLNEINPLPGGLYMHNWKKTGISPKELVEQLIHLAEARYQSQQKLNHVFSSSVLQNSPSGQKNS